MEEHRLRIALNLVATGHLAVVERFGGAGPPAGDDLSGLQRVVVLGCGLRRVVYLVDVRLLVGSFLAAALDACSTARRRRLRTTASAAATLALTSCLHDRKPIIAHSGDDHGDVAGALVNAACTATGTRPKASKCRALVGEARNNDQLFGVLTVVIHGVRDG